jgi:uncharacterized protein (DUF1919 family)
VAEWEEALETDHQRQAKLIVMEAIHAAERRGKRMGWDMARKALLTKFVEEDDETFVNALNNLPYPEKDATDA